MISRLSWSDSKSDDDPSSTSSLSSSFSRVKFVGKSHNFFTLFFQTDCALFSVVSSPLLVSWIDWCSARLDTSKRSDRPERCIDLVFLFLFNLCQLPNHPQNQESNFDMMSDIIREVSHITFRVGSIHEQLNKALERVAVAAGCDGQNLVHCAIELCSRRASRPPVAEHFW